MSKYLIVTRYINKLPCCEVFKGAVGSPEPVPGEQRGQEG